jgi:hypothetical protein
MADYIPKLGTLPDKGDARDAIHIACLPVLVSEVMMPGQHVGIDEDRGEYPDIWVCKTGEWIGIIDPFLKHPVVEGDRVWMLMYPGTITGLRHHWKHPALPTPLLKRPVT